MSAAAAMNRPAANSRAIIGRGMIGSLKGLGRRSMMPGDAASSPSTPPIGATIAMWIHRTWSGLNSAVPATAKRLEPTNARMNMNRLATWTRMNFCRLS